MSKPTPENEARAWDAVSPTVNILRDVYDYSFDLSKLYLSKKNPVSLFTKVFIIESGLPKLLGVLCEGDVSKNLARHQGLAKLFAELLDFAFEFDHLKVK